MNPLMPVDTSWFDRSPERYLQRKEFVQFQDVADVDFHDLLSEDPLGPFLVQHLGSPQNPFKSWGLNFRTMETMHTLLEKAGFDEIAIYDDANYPNQEGLSHEILYGIDPLPSAAIGGSSRRAPLNLPKAETLSKRIGYNWIAVAKKY